MRTHCWPWSRGPRAACSPHSAHSTLSSTTLLGHGQSVPNICMTPLLMFVLDVESSFSNWAINLAEFTEDSSFILVRLASVRTNLDLPLLVGAIVLVQPLDLVDCPSFDGEPGHNVQDPSPERGSPAFPLFYDVAANVWQGFGVLKNCQCSFRTKLQPTSPR